MACTGAAPKRWQMSTSQADLSLRSSLAARTLINSWLCKAAAISRSTAAERPAEPIVAVGWSECARARNARRSLAVSSRLGATALVMATFWHGRAEMEKA
jgi:hypothetical protein